MTEALDPVSDGDFIRMLADGMVEQMNELRGADVLLMLVMKERIEKIAARLNALDNPAAPSTPPSGDPET